MDISLILGTDEVLRYKLEGEYDFMLPSPAVPFEIRYEAAVDLRPTEDNGGPDRVFVLHISEIEVTKTVNQELEEGQSPWKEDIEAWVALEGGFIIESKGTTERKGHASTFVGGGPPGMSTIASGSFGFYYKCQLLAREHSAGKD